MMTLSKKSEWNNWKRNRFRWISVWKVFHFGDGSQTADNDNDTESTQRDSFTSGNDGRSSVSISVPD